MKIVVLGATGMLGYSIFSALCEDSRYVTKGTVRSVDGVERFFDNYRENLLLGVDITSADTLRNVLLAENPDVVINCIGLIKQQGQSKSHVNAISINSLLPHQLAEICSSIRAKLIHFSTDCVFSGAVGHYHESSLPDATDLYGRSKCLGEVDYEGHLTLRTSIIGHELRSNISLIDWFLSQETKVKGFSKAIFSGLPTCYIAALLKDYILCKHGITGLYHLSVNPIDKYTLLKQVAKVYSKEIVIEESDEFVIDRSLSSERFWETIGLNPPDWTQLIRMMNRDFLQRYNK